MTDFFADTYAILAYLAGDEAYGRRFRGVRFQTGLWNVYEAHYAQLLRDVAPDEADRNLAPFEAVALAPDPPILRAASRILADARSTGRALSAVDALGYAQARDVRLPLLTGDPAFRGLAGVEFLGPAARRR